MKLRNNVSLETTSRGQPAIGTVTEDCYAIMDGGAHVVCYVPISAGYQVAQEIARVLSSSALEEMPSGRAGIW